MTNKLDETHALAIKYNINYDCFKPISHIIVFSIKLHTYCMYCQIEVISTIICIIHEAFCSRFKVACKYC